MNRFGARTLLLTAVAGIQALLPGPLLGQDSTSTGERERVAGIVAVVGDSAITNYDVQILVLRYAQQRGVQPPPENSPEYQQLARSELNAAIDELLILQAAARDTSIHVDEQRVNRMVEDRIAETRNRFNGDAGFQAALRQQGMTEPEFREGLLAQTKRQALVQMFMSRAQQSRKPPPVTEDEMRAFFEQNRAQVGTLPATITFDQVVVPVTPSDTAVARATALADSLRTLIVNGDRTFADLAKQFSADGSAESGGNLGWHRRGGFVKKFDDVAFSPLLQRNEVSPPIRTEFGVHILKYDQSRGAERQVHHILIRPTITDEDVERARELGRTVAERLRNGERPGSIAETVGDPEARVRVGPLVRDSLPAPYSLLSNADRSQLAGAAQGEVVGPFLVDQGPSRNFLVAKIITTEDARPATYEDFRETIRQRLAQQKLYEEIIADQRRRIRVDIRLGQETSGG